MENVYSKKLRNTRSPKEWKDLISNKWGVGQSDLVVVTWLPKSHLLPLSPKEFHLLL